MDNKDQATQATQTVQVKKVNKDAILPERAYSTDAGADLFSCEDRVIPPGVKLLIGTGIKLAIPPGYEGQIRPKSGMAVNHGVTILNTPGTIDPAYRGVILVLLWNTGVERYEIKKGDKIAQLIIAPVAHLPFTEVNSLPDSSRGQAGWGSTGLRSAKEIKEVDTDPKIKV